MPNNTSALMSSRTNRIQSVENFNIKTLRVLNYYGGYSTTKILSIIHDYTRAGVRKRMKSMVKNGWIKKVEHDEGLGRSEQIWCITKPGRIAAQSEQDNYVETSKLKGFSICDYSPALHIHTSLVQVLASHIDKILDHTEIKPFKLEVREYGRNRYVYPDIIFDLGLHTYRGKDVTVYDLYEVELTVKSIKRYKDLFIRIALHNEMITRREDGYLIGDIIYITTPQLFDRLKGVLRRVSSNVDIYLFDYLQIIDQDDFDFEEAKLDLSQIKHEQLELRQT